MAIVSLRIVHSGLFLQDTQPSNRWIISANKARTTNKNYKWSLLFTFLSTTQWVVTIGIFWLLYTSCSVERNQRLLWTLWKELLLKLIGIQTLGWPINCPLLHNLVWSLYSPVLANCQAKNFVFDQFRFASISKTFQSWESIQSSVARPRAMFSEFKKCFSMCEVHTVTCRWS